MKALKGKISLEFREGIGLDIPKNIEIEISPDMKFGHIYSTKMGRYSSIFNSITEINRRGEEVSIKLDRRLAGDMGNGESVYIILSVSPPVANNIYLVISHTLPLPQGDWSTIIREGNIGKTIDYGNTLSFVYPSETREPFVVQGQVMFSIPYPPVIVSSGTKFQLIKADQFKIDELLSNALNKRNERAKELEKGIKDGYYADLVALKNNELESLGRSFEFTAQPNMVYDALKTAFSSFIIAQEKIVTNEDLMFAANQMYVTSDNEKNRQIIEISITGRENNGLVAIWIYGRSADEMKRLMVREILPKTNQLIEGIKEGPELIDMYCAANCGEMLELDYMDEKGIITCPACDTINFVPSRLRIH